MGVLVTDLFKTETEIASELSRNLFDTDCDLKQARAELTLCQKQHGRAKLLLDERIGSLSAVEVLQTELDKHELTISALEEKKARIKTVAEEKKGLARFKENHSRHHEHPQCCEHSSPTDTSCRLRS